LGSGCERREDECTGVDRTGDIYGCGVELFVGGGWDEGTGFVWVGTSSSGGRCGRST